MWKLVTFLCVCSVANGVPLSEWLRSRPSPPGLLVKFLEVAPSTEVTELPSPFLPGTVRLSLRQGGTLILQVDFYEGDYLGGTLFNGRSSNFKSGAELLSRILPLSLPFSSTLLYERALQSRMLSANGEGVRFLSSSGKDVFAIPGDSSKTRKTISAADGGNLDRYCELITIATKNAWRDPPYTDTEMSQAAEEARTLAHSFQIFEVWTARGQGRVLLLRHSSASALLKDGSYVAPHGASSGATIELSLTPRNTLAFLNSRRSWKDLSQMPDYVQAMLELSVTVGAESIEFFDREDDFQRTLNGDLSVNPRMKFGADVSCAIVLEVAGKLN